MDKPESLCPTILSVAKYIHFIFFNYTTTEGIWGLFHLYLECKIQVGDLSENGNNFGHKNYPVSYKRQIHSPYLTVTLNSELEN